ncbi:MAG: toprim domain-containing protein, partial [Clostridia bacterium]
AMVEVLEKNSNINHVNLCLDNDKTGHQTVDRFGKLLREIGVDFDFIFPSGKDFNEDVKKQMV